MKRKKIEEVEPSDYVAIAQRRPDDADAIRDRLRKAEGKEEGKLARANPNYGYDPFPR